jgi:acyl-CoA synthetase (AMP-forming)/AMP-acid ligase II
MTPLPDAASSEPVNVAWRLASVVGRSTTAAEPAIVSLNAAGGVAESWSATRLVEEAARTAAGLAALGIQPGHRVAVLVPPGPRFFALMHGLLHVGAVMVLIDPGMGIQGLSACLKQADPVAFIGSPKALLARKLFGWCPKVRWVLRVGGFFPGVRSITRLPAGPAPAYHHGGPAGILFTSGSTGPAKGALYTQANFLAQCDALGRMLDIRPGENDLSTFPLFGLYAPLLGMRAIIPRMDFTRPGSANPAYLLQAIRTHQVDNLFGSPALLNRLLSHPGVAAGGLQRLKRVVSAGAPVPAPLLRRLAPHLARSAQVFTPYGATEALPVACIGSADILETTSQLTAQGKGTCVGWPAPGATVRILALQDGPLDPANPPAVLPPGEVGEIAVAGDQVTRSYFNRPDMDASHKVRLLERLFHRMGDLGYLDSLGRIWFLGRKSQRVRTAAGDLPADAVESVALEEPGVFRAGLVGVGSPPDQKPVLAVQVSPGTNADKVLAGVRARLKACPATRAVKTVVRHKAIPVDKRHNSKIQREALTVHYNRVMR